MTLERLAIIAAWTVGMAPFIACAILALVL